MSGPTEPGAPPPEVPEEFAAAYRAAYEQALAAQAGPPSRREEPVPDTSPATDDTQDLPVRRGPLRIGTHRAPPPPLVYDDDEPPSLLERITRSAWFVPFLLVLLAILLIVGAYTVGRSFADRVAENNRSTTAISEIRVARAG